MKDALVIGLLCVAAIAIGAWLYLAPQTSQDGAEMQDTTSAPAQPMAPAPQQIGFTALDSGDHSGVITRKNYAIHDAKEFAELWKKAHDGSDIAPPAVDFSKDSVIAVYAGKQQTGGYVIAVTGVTDTEDTRTVAITLTSPGANCVTTQALTSPYQFIVIPDGNGKTLEHTDTVQVIACP